MSNKENEIVIYAKIGDPTKLSMANSFEEQQQIETKFSNGTPCRVRKTGIDKDSKYTFTYKIKTPNESNIQSNDEYNTNIDQKFFNGFVLVADKQLFKTRYIFLSKNISLNTVDKDGNPLSIVIPSIKYEVDVYKKPDGEYSQWCKIDIEIDSIIEFINKNHPDVDKLKINIKINHLPFAPSDWIIASTEDPNQKEFISNLWETEFNHKV